MNDLIDKIEVIIRANIDSLYNAHEYSDEIIDAYEQELNVNFPKSYRYFLKKYGFLFFSGFQLYGIDGITPPSIESQSVFDVRNATRMAREDGFIDDKMIAIGDSGYGTIYSIDLSSIDDKGESPIVETNPLYNETNEKEMIALTLAEFVLEQISGDME